MSQAESSIDTITTQNPLMEVCRDAFNKILSVKEQIDESETTASRNVFRSVISSFVGQNLVAGWEIADLARPEELTRYSELWHEKVVKNMLLEVMLIRQTAHQRWRLEDICSGRLIRARSFGDGFLISSGDERPYPDPEGVRLITLPFVSAEPETGILQIGSSALTYHVQLFDEFDVSQEIACAEVLSAAPITKK